MSLNAYSIINLRGRRKGSFIEIQRMHFLSMRQLAWSLVLFAAYLYLGHARFILVEVEEPKKEKLATALMKGVRYNTFCIACTNITNFVCYFIHIEIILYFSM